MIAIGFRGLGDTPTMTVEMAKLLLSTGKGTPEQLALANKTYYNSPSLPGSYLTSPSVIAPMVDQGATPYFYTYPSAPGCRIVNLDNDNCVLDNGQNYNCKMIRECDPLTGIKHIEYAIAGYSGNVGTTIIGQASASNYANNIDTATGLPIGGKVDITKATPVQQPNIVSVVNTIPATVPAAKVITIQANQQSTTNPVNSTNPVNAGQGSNNQSPTSVTNVANGSMPSMINNLIETLKGGTIFGIPDWILLAGALGGLFFYSSAGGHRR